MFFLQDPHLRNLESKRALQQKIVEAAEKLLKEDGLDKTVKRTRRNNHLDSKRKLEDIEREINNYKIGARLAPRGSLISAGTGAGCSLKQVPHGLFLII